MAKILVYQMWLFTWEGLNEMTNYLPQVKKSGVHYVWLGPLYKVPDYTCKDGAAGYLSIDRRFGTMQDFDDFVSAAHQLGLKVLIELSIEPAYLLPANKNVWFINGKINHKLVRKFRKVVKFWLHEHKVDGFSLNFSRRVSKKNTKIIKKSKKSKKSSTPNKQVKAIVDAIFGGLFPIKANDDRPPRLITENAHNNTVDRYYCHTIFINS